VTNIMS